MLGAITSGNSTGARLKSRRAMLETLVKHLDMVRLRAPVFALLALSACSGLIDGNSGGDTSTPEEAAARKAFVDKAKPVFDLYCISCHAGSDPTVKFLEGADAMAQRASLMGFDPQVVNLDAPQSSRILTKGAHSGPALTAQQSSDILQWVGAERDAAGATGAVDTGLETAAFTPTICPAGTPTASCPINYVELGGLVEGWAGAKIKFVAQALSQDLYVTSLALEGGTEGVYLEHPLFVSWPAAGGDPIPDTLDRFFNVKLNLMPGAMPEAIAGGTAAFINFVPTNQITIHFKVVDRYRPDSGGTGTGTTAATGCKQLASFKTNARAPMQTNCGSCHANAGNANARGAMDLVNIGSTDDAMLQMVCDQARTRINFQDTNASGFYIAPNPAMTTNHPFKFPAQTNFDTFKAAVDIWVQAEKTSQ